MVKKKKKARENKEAAQRIWTGVSHGFHRVEGLNKVDHGTVHAQREQIEGQEYWLFGTFDEQMCSGITKYLQSHLFDKNLTEVSHDELVHLYFLYFLFDRSYT